MYRRFTSPLLIGLLAFFLSNTIKTEANVENYYAAEELCYMSATELIQLFKAQLVSPVDVLEAQIERIERLNAHIGAITEKHYAEALEQARASATRYQQGTARPLEGLTCAIKDDLEVKNWRSSMGSLIFEYAPLATEDSALITILRDAGVVMHVQTNVPEFYCNLVTWNKLYGICRNPWNLDYTPGGSSGGATAALAAGFTTLAIGSDMGGSIRFPAAMTGMYGFKPPYGRVATSLTQYESEGPLARTFEDMNIFQNALAGPSPTMISAVRPKLEYPLAYGDIKGWKLAYDPMDHWGFPLDNTVRSSMEQAVQKLRSLGAEVVEVDLGLRAEDFEIYALGLFSTSMGPLCLSAAEKNLDLVTSYIAKLVEKYLPQISSQHLVTAEKWIYAHSNYIQKMVFSKGFKAIIMPTMCTPYVVADLGINLDNNVMMINGQPCSAATWVYSFTWPWNILGQYPVINVPIGLTEEHLPLGMQIIGNTYDDLTVFQIASEWAKVAPNFYKNRYWPTLP